MQIVLALGQSHQLNLPEWCLKDCSHTSHIFSDSFSWDLTKQAKSIAIIGGGISAIQAALYAHSQNIEVHLISRHALRRHQFDSDPGWLGPKI